MSNQRPDNVASPDWAKDEVLASDTKLEETCSFSAFRCQEQLWDWEGKDARKLLVTHTDFSKKHRLGEDNIPDYTCCKSDGGKDRTESVNRSIDIDPTQL